MAHGGQRPGSGRPTGSKSQNTLEREALRQYVFDEVKRNQKKVVAALVRQTANSLSETLLTFVLMLPYLL